MTKLNELVAAFIDRHRLPGSFVETAEDYYVPLARWVHQCLSESRKARPLVLGINGAQGTGKSTLAEFIRDYLTITHNQVTLVLSIDDLYLTRAQRQVLAKQVHPLLMTRGVPGTHDVELGLDLIESLKNLEIGQDVLVPRFDKSTDDRFDESEWTSVSEPVDLIILEGWCVGSESVDEAELGMPINELEANDDPDGLWRGYVNRQLKEVYPPLFGMLDGLVFLAAPDFDCIHRWRSEQEAKLAASATGGQTHVMNESQIRRFIQHYERITRENMRSLPTRADVKLELGRNHQVVSSHYRE